ncbi:MAG: RHS repeat domain-containing protein, partial [Thermoanaerobaculia bacterium]
VASGSVRLNDGSGFGEDRSWSQGAGSFDLGIPGEEEQLLAAFPLSNPLRKLVLPFKGTVTLTGGIQKGEPGGDGATVEIHHNDGRIWQREIAAGDTAVCTPGPSGCGAGLTFNVSGGDRLYFLAGSILGTDRDTLRWAPRIAYTSVSGNKDLEEEFKKDPLRREPGGAFKFIFDAREDFRLAEVGPATEVLSGGWHGWFYGEWNGDVPFAEPGLKEPEDEAETPLFVAGVADADGLEGIPGPVWTAAGFDLYLSADGVKPSRRGRDVVADLGSAGGTGGSSGPGIVRRTSGTTVGMGFNAGAGISLSCGSSETQLDLVDLNGDRFPDQVLGSASLSTDIGSCFGLAEEGTGDAGAVRLSNGHTGFESLSTIEGFESPVRRTVDSTIATTVGLGLNYSKKDGKGGSKAVVSAMPSVGSALSLSQTTTDLVDVNGDGLPDRVLMTPGTSSVSVRLNLGNRFGAPESWSLPAWDSDEPCHDFATIAQAGLSELTSFGTFDSLRHNRASAVNAGLAVGPIGGGVGTTLSRTVVDLADVNGDGLLDHVARDQGGAFRVKLNRGDRWGAEESWSDPSWPGSALDDMGGLFQCLDAVSSTGNVDGNGSVGAPICIPLVAVGIRIEVSVQVSGADGGTQLFFEDLDGDGLADRVLRGSDKTVYVKSNKAGKVNLLSAVHRPLGSTVTLDYKRQGNRVGTAADGRRIDMPTSQWVLSSAAVDDGRGNLYRTGFEYFNDAFHDRAERESYGYARVRTTLPDGSTVDRTFHNQDYTRKGLLAREVTADAAGNPLRSRTVDYSVRPLGARSAFPARVKETTFFHEGETAAQKTTSETFEYDELGNVVRFADQADTGTADDVLASVSYHVDPATYVIQPERIEVRDGTGRLLRQRTAAYDGLGDLVRLEQMLSGGKDPESGAPYSGTRNAVSTFSYDGLGNLAAATDPSGFASSFTYDPVVRTHPVQVTDSFGYTSRSAWDLKHGVPVETVDWNGNAVRQTYDAFGRLIRVAGPYDSDASPTLAIEYDPAASPARAIVHHKDATRPDPIDTAVFIDALGRTLQTQEDAELDLGTGTSTRTGVRVSGRIAFDAKGRIAAEGQPVFASGPAGQFVDVPLNNPTALSYDALDRVREVRFPHGAVTRMAYGFGTLDGEVRLATVRTDANGRATRFYNDVKGDVLGVEQANTIGGVRRQLVTRYGYDALSQLTSVLDARGNATRLEYDTLGRNVVLDSPDAGRTEMRYDTAGSLGAKITANLAALGQQVRYLRTFHRLDRIDYPAMADVAYTYGGPGAPFNRAGRVATVTDESGVEERSYGKLGEVVRTVRTLTAQNGNSPRGPYATAFRYDSFERLLSVVYPDGEELAYTYDAGGKVQSIPGYLRHQGYDEFGERARTLYANGAETRASYDPASRFLARLQTLENGGRELQDLAYQRDGLGTVLAIQNDVALPAPPLYGGPSAQTFRYDDLYQLVAAEGSLRSPPNKTSTYKLALAYDEIGNTTSKSQLQQVASGGGKANTEKKTSYDWAFAYGGPHPGAATRIGDRTFRYDLNGNQTGWDTDQNGTRRTLTWDEENRLKSAADNGQTTRFLYGADGVRTSKAGPHGETLYVNAWYSVKNGTIASKHVFAGGARIATKLRAADERRYFYHSDPLRSTGFVTDDLGKAWQHLEYFPSGEVWADERSETQRTPYLFGGKELDEETGLSYFGFRYYDARQGQWLSADPILDELLDTGKLSRPDLTVGAFHLPGLAYGYVGNSPTNFVDPEGLAKYKTGGIYVLKDGAGKVRRTGRGDLKARRRAHLKDHSDLTFVVKFKTNNQKVLRGLEHLVYNKYPGARASGKGGGRNKVRVISPKNPKKQEYLDAADDWLDQKGFDLDHEE